MSDRRTHARRVGNLLFLSGVGPRRRGSKEIPGVVLNPDATVKSYDIEAQCHSVFRNVRYILEDAGADWDDLVDVTVFLTNITDDYYAGRRDAEVWAVGGFNLSDVLLTLDLAVEWKKGQKTADRKKLFCPETAP